MARAEPLRRGRPRQNASEPVSPSVEPYRGNVNPLKSCHGSLHAISQIKQQVYIPIARVALSYGNGEGTNERQEEKGSTPARRPAAQTYPVCRLQPRVCKLGVPARGKWMGGVTLLLLMRCASGPGRCAALTCFEEASHFPAALQS